MPTTSSHLLNKDTHNAIMDLLTNHPNPGPHLTDRWTPGTLLQAVIHDSGVTPFLALGNSENVVHAIAIHPNTPAIYTFSTDALHKKDHKCPSTTGLDHALNQNPVPYLKPHSNAIAKQLPLLSQIAPNLLPFYVKDDTPTHPIALRSQLITQEKITRNSPTAKWLLAASTKQPNNPARSIFHLAPTNPSLPFSAQLSSQIIADLEDIWPTQAQDLLTLLTDANVLHAIEPNPTPPATQPPADATPAPPTPPPTNTTNPTTTPPPLDPPAPPTLPTPNPTPNPPPPPRPHPPPQLYDLSKSPPPPQPPQPLNALPPNAQPHTAQLFPPHHPPPPPVTPPKPDLHTIANAKLLTLMSKPNPSPHDVAQMNVYATILGSKSTTTHDTPTPPPTTRNLLLFHLIGWSGLPLQHLTTFHTLTNSAWHNILASTKEREQKVEHYFTGPLIQKFPKLQGRLLHDWTTTVAKFRFAPEPHMPGNKSGLGPMAFVARTTREISAAEHQRHLNAEATTISTSDVLRTKLNTPIVPRTVYEVIDVIDNQIQVLMFLFTPHCPLARELLKVHAVLQAHNASLNEIHNFQWEIAAELLWQLTITTRAFFSHRTTEADLQLHNTPRPNLDPLVMAIAGGLFHKASNKPPMFCPPTPKRPRHPQHTDSPRRTRPDRKDNPPVHTKDLPTQCRKIITAKKKPNQRFPTIASARAATNCPDDAAFATRLGIQPNDCIRYHFFGVCDSPRCRRTHEPRQTSPDHATMLETTFNSLPSTGSKSPPFIGLMHPRGPVLAHPAAPDLLRWSTSGCPVDCGRPWTLPELEAAIARGAHPSARAPDAAAACRTEALARVADGCCRVVNWDTLRDSPPKNLKVSPIAAIPHKSRAYRMILDLSFELRLPTHTVPAVNATSNKTLAPQHAMYELGRVVPRLIHAMAATDTTLPLWFTKLDLKDGYWRMVVNPVDAWNFAYVLPPTNPSDPVQLVIPDSLQMGWSESPPFFCAATETARDVAAKTLRSRLPLPPHPMEPVIMDTSWPPAPPNTPPLSHTWLEVYIDDFIAMAQSPDPAHFRQVARHLLHAIDNTFPGPDISGSSMGPAVSEKKLQAEGRWHTTKEVLGWIFDGTSRTISLPATKRDRIRDTARSLLATPTFRLKEFEQLHGKLQFLSVSLPCGKALLGPGDRILSQANARQAHKIACNPFVTAYLNDWLDLLTISAARPTHAKELILHPPSYVGCVDASRWGVGGVWFAGTETLEPCVWFLQWPQDITLALCSRENPKGPITICDLELAGIFLHFLALADYLRRYNRSLRHQSVSLWCDNLAAVHWTDRFRTAQSTRAGRLLRAFATQLHHHEAALLDIRHIPARLLDTVPPERLHRLEALFRTTNEAIDAGVVAATTQTRRRFWRYWSQWVDAHFPQVGPHLTAPRPAQLAILAAYAHDVRTGTVTNAKTRPVRAQTVLLSLRAIATTLQLAGQQNPLGPPQSPYPKALQQLLTGYARADPPTHPRLAVPLAVPHYLLRLGSNSPCPKTKAIGEMAIIAFYYLLRAGEYTYSPPSTTKLTTHFTISDVTFWDHTTRLPHDLPRATLLARCTAATLHIRNQKNGKQNESIHHEATHHPTCPVRALLNRVTTLRAARAPPHTCISAYILPHTNTPITPRATDFNRAIKHAVTALNLHTAGIPADLVGSHSFRAGGAMAMYLNGVPTVTIQKFGRWKSDAFLHYLHEQIAQFSHGISSTMAKPFPFHNIRFSTPVAVTPERHRYHQTNPFRIQQTLRINPQPPVDPLDDITDFEDSALIDAIMATAETAANRLAACKSFLSNAPPHLAIHAISAARVTQSVDFAQPAMDLYNELESRLDDQIAAGAATPGLKHLFCTHLADHLAAEPPTTPQTAPPPPPPGAASGTLPPKASGTPAHNTNSQRTGTTTQSTPHHQQPTGPHPTKKQKTIPPRTPQKKPIMLPTALDSLQPAPRGNTNPINSATDFKTAYDRYFNSATTFTPKYFTDHAHPAFRCIAMAAWCLQAPPKDVETIYENGAHHNFVYDLAVEPTAGSPLSSAYNGYTLHALPDTLTLANYLNPVHYHWKKHLTDEMASRLLNPIVLELCVLSDGNNVTIKYHQTFCMIFKPAHLLYVGRRPYSDITHLNQLANPNITTHPTLDPAFHIGDVLEWQMSFPPGNQHDSHICKKLGSKLFPVWTTKQPTQNERRTGLKILAAYKIRRQSWLSSSSTSFASKLSSSASGATI